MAPQVKYSVLDRSPETDGTLAKCQDLGVSVIAHSPLEQGVLTDRALTESGFGGKQAQQVRCIQNTSYVERMCRAAPLEQGVLTSHAPEHLRFGGRQVCQNMS